MNWEAAVAPWRDPDRTFAYIKGRVALYAILQAAGIGPGDEVLVPGFTCVVVPAAVKYTGATPLFYDIDPDTLNGDPSLAEALISPRTKAIIVQHTFGLPADLGRLPDICRNRGICLIEDCAHAIGASIGARPVGTLGDAAFCSFQWSKPVTTGLGGLALVMSQPLAERMQDKYAKHYREPSSIKSVSLALLSTCYNHFFRPRYFWLAQDLYRWAGRNSLVQPSSSESELQSSSMPTHYLERFGKLRSKQLRTALSSLPHIINHRLSLAELYIARLDKWHSYRPRLLPNSVFVALRIPILVHNRDKLLRQARAARIEIGDWFNAPLHPRNCNSLCFGYHMGRCPVTELTSRHIINLPTHSHVQSKDVEKILSFLNDNHSQIMQKHPFSLS